MARPPQVTEWLTEDGLLTIEGLARDGLGNKEIAKKLGIGACTWYDWKRKHPELQEAYKKGKAPVDIKVENQMLKSALGYTVTVRKPVKLREVMRDGAKQWVKERIEYVEEEIYVPPQSVNQFYWLKNRQSGKWSDHPQASRTDTLARLDEVLATLGGVE